MSPSRDPLSLPTADSLEDAVVEVVVEAEDSVEEEEEVGAEAVVTAEDLLVKGAKTDSNRSRSSNATEIEVSVADEAEVEAADLSIADSSEQDDHNATDSSLERDRRGRKSIANRTSPETRAMIATNAAEEEVRDDSIAATGFSAAVRVEPDPTLKAVSRE